MYSKTRICSRCQKVLSYSCSSSYFLAQRNNAKCRSCSTINYAKRKGNAERLLMLDNESYYWIGFILADGHISDNRLVVTLSDVDLSHLQKLGKFLSCKVKQNFKGACSISIMNKTVFSQICSLFEIHNDKTYNPPSLNIFQNLDNNQILSLFAGFIDGDGSIRNLHNRPDFNLQIKCHSSWYFLLEFFRKSFFSTTGSTKINKQGYAYMSCGNTMILKQFRKKVEELNLPIMRRKWETINFDYVGRNEKKLLKEKNYET